MFARNGKLTDQSSRFLPKLESLEDRLPFAADLAIDFDLGEVEEGLDPPEFVVVGGVQNGVDSAAATSLDDGGHLFVYSEESSNHTEIYGRITNPDGSPGPLPTLLKTIPTGSSTIAPETLFATTSLEGGGFALVWGNSSGVSVQTFDSQLNPQSVEVVVAQGSTTGINLHALDMLQRLNGNLAIAYSDPTTGQMTVREYPADLSGTPTQWQDSNQPNQNESPPFHANLQELPNSGVRLSWTTNDANDALAWAVYTIDVDSATSNSPERWSLTNYASMPQVAYQTDGDIVLAGVKQIGGGYETTVRLLDAQKTELSETILNTSFAVLGDLHSVAILDDDSYAVSGFFGSTATEGLFIQAFNATGSMLGLPEALNESDTNTQMHSGIFALDSGAYAAYWLGFALDGVSTAVYSRTVQLETTDVFIEITDQDSVVDQGSAVVILDGIPESAGLNKGTRIDDTSWEVSVQDLDDLQILNFQERETMLIEITLVDSTDASTLASFTPAFGSEYDDFIPITSIDELIDGREGIDTIFVSENSDQFTLAPKADGEYQLASTDGSYDLLLRDVEFVSFYDQTLQLETDDFLPVEELDEDDLHEFDDFDDSVPWLFDDYYLEDIIEFEFGEFEFGEFEFFDDGPDFLPPPPPGFHEHTEVEHVHSPFGEFGPEDGEHAEIEESLFTARPAPEAGPKSESIESAAHGEHTEAPTPPPVEPGVPEVAELSGSPGVPADLNESQLATQGHLQLQVGVDLHAPQPQMVQNAVPVPRLSEQFHAQIVTPPAVASVQPTSTTAKQTVDLDVLEEVSTISDTLPDVAFENDLFTVAPAFDADLLFDNLDEVVEEAKSDQVVAEVVVGSAVVVATGVSIAHVAWLLRGSILFTKLLSSMPIWISFDPLPLLRDVHQLPVDSLPNESLVDIVSSGK